MSIETSEPVEEFKIGTNVIIQNLESLTHYNGMIGKVNSGKITEGKLEGRYEVIFSSDGLGNKNWFKPKNLSIHVPTKKVRDEEDISHLEEFIQHPEAEESEEDEKDEESEEDEESEINQLYAVLNWKNSENSVLRSENDALHAKLQEFDEDNANFFNANESQAAEIERLVSANASQAAEIKSFVSVTSLQAAKIVSQDAEIKRLLAQIAKQ